MKKQLFPFENFYAKMSGYFKKQMAQLFIVATPIGNLEDMTFRAVRILKEVDIIVCEDTRKTGILLKKYEIEKKILNSFHAQSSEKKAQELVEKIKAGKNIAYVSDAGTPGISDPGFVLIKFAVEQGIDVVPIPGASALVTLVSVSGFPIDKFKFAGFLPHKKGRQTFIKNLEESKISTIFYESVHRFPRLLKEMNEFLGASRRICVGRELTKMYEDVFRGTVGEALEYFNESNTRGEFVVLVGPKGF